MPEPVLVADHLGKVFRAKGNRRAVVAVDDVSFTVREGDSLALVGESGSGKTTVARMLLGLEIPTSGRVTIGGRPVKAGRMWAKDRRRFARDIQIVFQDPYTSLDPRQSVGSCISEVIRLHFRMSAVERMSRISELLGQVGLEAQHARARPRALSGGQRQRVAIARALAARPRILILDEPVSALDVSIQAQILNLLSDIRANTNVSYVFISHDLAVIRQVTEDAIVMRRGKIVERGATPSVLDRPQHPYTQLLRASVPSSAWLARGILADAPN